MSEPQTAEPPRPKHPLFVWLHRLENGLLIAAMAAMVLLGVADLEFWEKLKIPVRVAGADSLIRHLTLIMGMLGGMVAARESRLLAISSFTQFMPKHVRRWTELGSGIVATVITAYLAIAAWQFVSFEREAGARLALEIPTWWTQAFLPAGFAIITVRVFWHAATDWKWRLAVLGASLGIGLGAWALSGGPDEFLTQPPAVVWGALIVLIVATLLGAPIFVTLGGAALILFWGQGDVIASIPLDHYDQVTNPLLATLPLFTLAGYFLAESNASRRLVQFFSAWTGFFRGGPAIVTAFACAFFTTFTGGSGVTILALGGLLLPVLMAARYDEKTALGLLTGAGSLGILFPPCLPLIIYSIVANVEMNQMFLGGLLPGLLMVVLAAGWGIWQGPKLTAEEKKFVPGDALKATWDAKWELLLPVIPLVLIFGGFALPVPAAAATAFYAFATQTFIHRELKFTSTLPKTMVECGLLVGGVLLILGTAMGLTNYLITQHVPDQAAEWISTAIESKLLFLLVLNLFLILVGCLMDIFAAIVVVVPLIAPMAAVFGIPPVQMGIIFLANLQLGYLTPPVGMNLFLASYRFDKPVMYITRASLPMLFVLAIGVLLITYVPAITTWLPDLFQAR
ncbi:MAG TPA: C4-dicarboxylate ABC transporter permease [Verrucomicrobiales bacterium]|nr:C4-dicarboxylate ABC transporter permease [Verrucomicrobiales bacterium]